MCRGRCTPAESSKPRARMSPRFWRWRVMVVHDAGLVEHDGGLKEMVTLESGPATSLQKKFPRRVSRSPQERILAPASPPVRVSAVRAGLALVTTLPTRKFRYSSLSVGARKAR